MQQLSSFHIGETVTALEKCSLVPGGSEIIVYATIMGSLGCLYPVGTREEAGGARVADIPRSRVTAWHVPCLF